jgi:bifunctional DNase/RNase
MIEVVVEKIQVNLVSQSRVVVLRETQGNRFLPIWIGQFEAEAIAMCLQEVEAVRPMTHDLMKSILQGLGAVLEKVEIHNLQDDVFYARLIVKNGNQTLEFDARPSDSIALAVRVHAPIFVSEEVMQKAGAAPEADIREQAAAGEGEGESTDERLDVFKDFIQRLDRKDDKPDEPPKS